MLAQPIPDLCVECQQRVANLRIRNRRLCSDCFIRYANSKILKRMESYRFRNLAGDQKHRLFLPISGGISSLVLLQVLDAQLQRQIVNRNRTAYELVIACVTFPDQAEAVAVQEWYTQLMQRFSNYTFLPLFGPDACLSLDTRLELDMEQLGYQRRDDEPDVDFCDRILSSPISVTAQADLQAILLRRLLVAIAKNHKCGSILWGHSDSRLAALSLADVAKGRGGSVSSSIADGVSPSGINFNYPVRDLFKAELYTYASVLPEPLVEAREGTVDSVEVRSTLRNTAIDNLLTDYINSQGVKYPSIMANVVRTASKLEKSSATLLCKVCIQPITGDAASLSEGVPELCYGCERMKQDIRV